MASDTTYDHELLVERWLHLVTGERVLSRDRLLSSLNAGLIGAALEGSQRSVAHGDASLQFASRDRRYRRSSESS